MLDQHRSKWDVFKYKEWEGIMPIEEADPVDLITFIAEHEVKVLEDTVTGEALAEEVMDLLRFLDIALDDACLESPKLLPLPPPEIPDINYDNA